MLPEVIRRITSTVGRTVSTRAADQLENIL
jgi:hypothetical protein